MTPKGHRTYFWIVPFLLFIAGGCLSLSEDVTPPSEQVTRPSPTLEVNQPTADQEISDRQDPSPTSAPSLNPSPAATPEEYMGQVRVFISHQTENDFHEDAQVTLEGYDHMTQVYSETQSVSENKQVQFDEVPFLTGRLYIASVAYQGAVYRSDIITLEPGVTTLDLKVEVFGTTTDRSALSIERLHVFVDFQQQDTAQFAEIFIISNYGEKTVVAEDEGKPVLVFPLPDGASDLNFRSGSLGDRFIKTADGFGDTMSIPPGSSVYQLLVFFEMPYARGRLDFEQKVNLPVGAVVVMTPSNGLTLRASNLADRGIREVDEGAIHVYAGQQMDPGEVLAFSLSGRPGQPAAGKGSIFKDPKALIGISVFGVVLLVIGVWFFLQSQEDRMLSYPLETEVVDKEEIIDTIIALDDLYEGGELAEDVYRSRREELKSRLRMMVKEGKAE